MREKKEGTRTESGYRIGEKKEKERDNERER